MAAFRQAHSDRADAIELDVVKTKDGKFVVMHDDTVDRTTNGKGAISDLTLDEIQSLDAGSWFGSKFAGERAPELGEVLDWAKGKTHVVIEVKTKTAAQSSGAELVELIRDKEVGDQVTVMSFDRKFVERVEAHAPDLDTGVLISAKASYKKAGIGAAVGAAAGAAAAQVRGNQHEEIYDRVDDDTKQQYRQNQARQTAAAGAAVGASRQRRERRAESNQASTTQTTNSQAYINCMKGKGYSVLP